MRVLTVNPGSSSVKLSVVDDGREVDHATVGAASAAEARQPLADLVVRRHPIDAAGVRFVHGGLSTDPVPLDHAETARLTALTPLAPLHQPLSLELAAVVAEIVPGPVYACFDTAFHARMPESAAHYALPRSWVREHELRRYGFHGLSCASALRRTAELLDREPTGLRLVCCHIGAGVSVTAVRDGHGVDTSMGFTPLEGAVMATRSGSVDPGLLLYLLRSGVTDAAGLDDALDRGSGLAGMTGTGGDVRDVLTARDRGDPDARTAIEVYLHRLRREIGAMVASLDRLDALVFTGGVAEHQPALLAELCERLGVFGVRTDSGRLAADGDRQVGRAHGAVRVLVVSAREGLEIARQTTLAMAARAAGAGGPRDR
ncbi:acetate kinase [Amycolatopsis sp. FBCC-B4732]|uniref:acetate/propionate family kinase n=1 Tax=Amycolatopsis sp. FBCC-B4732 TaxID=3079339 RepID=UPI001FF58CBC|nr:acetate kinase [Amycolatopsis sp. FBCC-B4732]UOX90442.1 acetate kinase [Amycolatopsis sp. FBCC-B4732]